jgi:integrase
MGLNMSKINIKNDDIKYNDANEIIKYKFFEWLHNSNEKDQKTVSQYIKAIHEFEVATKFKDFKNFTSDWAIDFKHHLNDKINRRTGESISKSLFVNYASQVKAFFAWITDKRYSTDYLKIKPSDISYFNVTTNDKNKAKATNYQESHKIEDILATIRKMPEASKIEMRNKAMISLCLLATPRISSLQTARINSIKYLEDYDVWAFIQNPNNQNTKYSKNITSFFIGQSQDIIENVIKWRDYLISKGFNSKSYLFPKIEQSFDSSGGSISVISNSEIKSQQIIRQVLKAAYKNNNLPYYKQHSFRHSIARKAKMATNATNCLIALAANAGQSNNYATLISSYGGDSTKELSQIIKGIKLE